jgi:site-specific DNA recombinase
LLGKLLDELGNTTNPSFSSKNDVRYKFQVSSSLLRGRKLKPGSFARVSATDIELTLINAVEGVRQRSDPHYLTQRYSI